MKTKSAQTKPDSVRVSIPGEEADDRVEAEQDQATPASNSISTVERTDDDSGKQILFYWIRNHCRQSIHKKTKQKIKNQNRLP
jgi:hypothetical protein